MKHLPVSPGEAVHAFFVFRLKDRRSPALLSKEEFKSILKKVPNLFLPDTIADSFIENTLFCWQYLYDLMEEADEYFLEPLLGNFRPDVQVIHQNRIYIIETKTIRPSHFPKRHLVKGKRQVKSAIKYLREECKCQREIFGYMLIFTFLHSGRLPDVRWKIISHSAFFPPA